MNNDNLRIITNDRLVEGVKLDNLPNNTNEELSKKQNNLRAGENVIIDDSDFKNPIIHTKIGENLNYEGTINKPKINGIELIGDRVLTRDDVALSKVDNTPDMEKPVSIYQQQAIDNLNALHLRNVTKDLPEATLENYPEIATSYISQYFGREPLARDWLWLKMTDNNNVTGQVMYIKEENEPEGAWLYSGEITTPNLSNYYTKTETDTLFSKSSQVRNIAFINSLPSSIDANTLYLLTE